MSLDGVRCLAAELPVRRHAWSADDVILYHLGIGAMQGTSGDERLRYALEDRLVVLPSFTVLGAMPFLLGLPDVDGFDVPLGRLLHAEHELTVHRAIPAEAAVGTTGRIVAVRTAGRNALIDLVAETTVEDTGELLATNRFGVFVRGCEVEPVGDGEPLRIDVPEREPDTVLEQATLDWQALLYRLSGDRNMLHADPELAASVGFDAPILHGLCTHGFVLLAVVEEALGGVPDAVERFETRFTGTVYPGERLRTALWRDSDRTIVLETTVAERDAPAALSRVTTREATT
jgi:acyl dehydratase